MIAMLEQNWISVSDAAALVGCTPQYLRALALDKAIPCERVGHAWLLDKNAIEKMAKTPAKTGRPRSRKK
jgi:excisionase family DNA binding protein